MSEINDLEQALVLAAADADSRNYEEQNIYQNSEEQEDVCKGPEFYKNLTDGIETTSSVIDENIIKKAKSLHERHQKRKHDADDGYQNTDGIEATSSVIDENRIKKASHQERHQKRKHDADDGYQNTKVLCLEKYQKRVYEGKDDNIIQKESFSHQERPQKRKHEDEEIVSKSLRGYANVVANHYNQLEEKGLDERFKSRIVHLRNFHNWIKSMLINEYLSKIKDGKKHNAPIRVHDMCGGKGGDLLKWRKGGITHLICSDIAAVSLEQCKARYTDMKNRSNRDRGPSLYTIEYITGDCSRMRLREKYSDPSMKLDLVSCQFAFHYSFESLPQAECMLRNAAECLQPGGYFIGTIPDAYDLVARAKKCKDITFGNNVYQVTIDFDINKPPLFGGKYNFQLDGVVNCPEFLVHFPTLVKLAKKFGLKLVKADKFYDYFERMKEEGKYLLSNMRSLEAFPPVDSTNLVGTDPSDYKHAEEFIKKEGKGNLRIGTLSKSEWEVSSLYTTFVFEKMKNTWNTDGTPVYNI